jgi:predicted DNA-binding helix-hairpin-helix protein
MRAERRLPEPLRTNAGLARLFMTAFRRGLCDGLFVTAGLPRNPARATARILDLVETLRVHHGYRGYVHVKAVPGAEPGQMQRLVRLSDRVSYHLEPACRRALLENPTARPAKGLELFASPERAALELRAALSESARRAPAPLPPTDGAAGRLSGQLSLFGTRSSFPSGGYAPR